MNKKTLLILALINFSNIASARCFGVSCEGKLSSIQIKQDTNILIQPKGGLSSLNCVAINNSAVLENTHPMQSEIYSLLLSAKLADNFVTFVVEENSDPCRITDVTLQN